MALTKAATIIGSHVYIFREGDSFTIPTAGTCSSTSKPGSTDAGWIDLGIIKTGSVAHGRTTNKIYAPLPGARRLAKVINTMHELSAKWTLQEISPIVIQMLFGTLPLGVSSTQYNPLEAPDLNAWVKFQWYSETDVLLNTVDHWAMLQINSTNIGDDKPFEAEVEFFGLYSTYNTGTL